jgi:hypothetical protein
MGKMRGKVRGRISKKGAGLNSSIKRVVALGAPHECVHVRDGRNSRIRVEEDAISGIAIGEKVAARRSS